ncbi:hypothetical protein Tco_1244963 [Tanacetum coccineum]
MTTCNQEIDKSIKDHDKAIADIQATLVALMKQHEQLIKQQEQLVQHVSGGSFIAGSFNNDQNDPKTNLPMHIGKVEFPRFSGVDVEAWIYSRFSNAMSEDPMEEIASLIQDDDLHEYNNAFDALLNKVEDEDEAYEENKEDEEEKLPQISIHALTVLPSYSTMRIRGAMGNRQLHILVNSKSTHNFIDVKLARKLQCSVKDIPSLNVDGKPCELKGIQTNKVSLCSMEKVDSLLQKHSIDGSI